MRISDWSSDVCSSDLPGLRKDPGDMLFRLADPLADKLAEVDLVEVYPPLAGHQLGGHRLSGAGRPGKKCNEAPAEAHLAVELHLLKEGDRKSTRLNSSH